MPLPLPPLSPGPYFGDQVREGWVEPGIHVKVLVPAGGPQGKAKENQLILFATPNGNTLDQTWGCAKADGLSWQNDIQHVAAQIRMYQASLKDVAVTLAIVEAEMLSWPAWRAKHPTHAKMIRGLVEALLPETPGEKVRVTLTGHSGGGSFLTGYLNGHEQIPDYVHRIAYLDSNYSYNDAENHGDKLLTWLNGDKDRKLMVIAYDDREITLNGKKVVGPDGGTYRATDRMLKRFRKDTDVKETRTDVWLDHSALNGQAAFHVHTNPDNKILHTALVGEMNGLLAALQHERPSTPRRTTPFIQPAPGIPQRTANAPAGRAIVTKLATLDRVARDEVTAKELLAGNLPAFLRAMVAVEWKEKDTAGKERTVAIKVMPDMLAIGSDKDWVRMPITPMVAVRVADAFGCQVPTRKLVNEIARAATVKLWPLPLSIERDAVATWAKNHTLVEAQRMGTPLGALVSGAKKDVVMSNLLAERTNRVAIYGWHYPDGTFIQPLSTVHVDWYLDYSHGVRLIDRNMTIDGKPYDLRRVLHDPVLHPLVSDEGPLRRPCG